MDRIIYIKVKLNENGWNIYKSKNAFWHFNSDDDGYSKFSYEYFERLFYPLAFNEFSHDVKFYKEGEK